MGRRTVEVDPTDPKEIRELIGKHFRELTGRRGVNMAQFQAQLQEEEMVQVLAGLAMDSTVAAGIRRQCAMDVVQIARGSLRPWVHDGSTVDQAALTGSAGRTVGDDIADARNAAEVYQELNDLTMRGVHPSLWPERVRLVAGQALVYFEEIASAEAA